MQIKQINLHIAKPNCGGEGGTWLDEQTDVSTDERLFIYPKVRQDLLHDKRVQTNTTSILWEAFTMTIMCDVYRT